MDHVQTRCPLSTTPSRLHTSLLSGWDRAVLTSLAEDLGHEFVDLVLPLLPEAAPELLRLLADHQGYNELWLLRNHAPLLWRHARAPFIARIAVAGPMLSPVELLADIAREASADEQGEVRALALAALGREHDPMRRGEALLEWAPLEAPDRRAAMIAEAVEIIRSASPGTGCSIARPFADRFEAAQRTELRAMAQHPDAGTHGSSLLLSLALAASAPADEVLTDARAALAHPAHAEPKDAWPTVCVLLEVVPFEVLRPWIDAWLQAIDDPRGLAWAAHQLAPRAPPEILDRLLERADELGVEIWRRAEILADVACHHPTRGKALRAQLRRAMDRVVGDATLGHRMKRADIPAGADVIVLQAQAMARAGAALGPDAVDLQRLVLARIAAMPSDFEHHHRLDALPWDELGSTLDPAARADGVQAALALRHRPTALRALGRMAAKFPAEARHLGLDGLSRLADATPPEAMKRALAALARARTETAAPAPKRAGNGTGLGRGGDTFSGWTAADQRSLAPLAAFLSSGDYLYPDRLQKLALALTPAAATRAAALVLEVTSSYDVLPAIMAVVSAPRTGKRDREELLTAALARIGVGRHQSFDATELAQAISEVCVEGDAVWSERVAAFFEAQRPEREAFLALVEAFAPLLRRLGGVELIAALVVKLGAPLPVPEFARPWAAAARGTVDA